MNHEDIKIAKRELKAHSQTDSMFGELCGIILEYIESLEERIAIMEEGTDSEWIPVTLGLPETDDSYFGRHIIVCDKRKQVFPLRYVRRNIMGKTVERWQEEDGRIYGRANIIAWQYMPKPPKDGE